MEFGTLTVESITYRDAESRLEEDAVMEDGGGGGRTSRQVIGKDVGIT